MSISQQPKKISVLLKTPTNELTAEEAQIKRDYYKKYNQTDKHREALKTYYQKNAEKIKAKQITYYYEKTAEAAKKTVEIVQKAGKQ